MWAELLFRAERPFERTGVVKETVTTESIFGLIYCMKQMAF